MEVKAVGVKALRDNLSRYLREAKSGTRVLVLDRDEVIAEIHEPTVRYLPRSPGGTADQMEKDGKLIRPRIKRTDCVPSPVKLAEGTAKRLIDEARSDADDPLH